MEPRRNSIEKNFISSLRHYDRSSMKKSRQPLQHQESEQILNDIQANINDLENGHYFKCFNSISLMFTDPNYLLRKHITFQLFVPEEKDFLGYQILSQQEIWILLLLYFDLINQERNTFARHLWIGIVRKMVDYLKFEIRENVLKKVSIYSEKAKIGQNIKQQTIPDNIDRSQLATVSDRSILERDVSESLDLNFEPHLLNNTIEEQSSIFQNNENQQSTTEDIIKISQVNDTGSYRVEASLIEQMEQLQLIQDSDLNNAQIIESLNEVENSSILCNSEQNLNVNEISKISVNSNQMIQIPCDSFNPQQTFEKGKSDKEFMLCTPQFIGSQEQTFQKKTDEVKQLNFFEIEHPNITAFESISKIPNQDNIEYDVNSDDSSESMQNETKKLKFLKQYIAENVQKTQDNQKKVTDYFSKLVGQPILFETINIENNKKQSDSFNEHPIQTLQNQINQDQIEHISQEQQAFINDPLIIHNIQKEQNQLRQSKRKDLIQIASDQKQFDQSQVDSFKRLSLNSTSRKRKSKIFNQTDPKIDQDFLQAHGSGFRYDLIKAPNNLKNKYQIEEVLVKKRSSKRLSYPERDQMELKNMIVVNSEAVNYFSPVDKSSEQLEVKLHNMNVQTLPDLKKQKHSINIIEEVVQIETILGNVNDNDCHDIVQIKSGLHLNKIALAEVQKTSSEKIHFEDFNYYHNYLKFHSPNQEEIYLPLGTYQYY